MKAPAIFQSAAQNILRYASFSADVSPSGTYAVDVLNSQRPDFRIKFPNTSVTLTAVVGGGSPPVDALGDILVVPASNLVDGVLSLTNDAGLNVSIPVPSPWSSGHPRTIVADLTALEPDPDVRTSGTWHLVIAGNDANVQIGGYWAIYGPKTYLVDRDVQWGYVRRPQAGFLEARNNHGIAFRQNLQTIWMGLDVSLLATDADADRIEDWFMGSNGRGQAGLLWFDPNVVDGYFGVLPDVLERRVLFPDVNQLSFAFDELAKGKPWF